jgi:hypothetical protein
MPVRGGVLESEIFKQHAKHHQPLKKSSPSPRFDLNSPDRVCCRNAYSSAVLYQCRHLPAEIR